MSTKAKDKSGSFDIFKIEQEIAEQTEEIDSKDDICIDRLKGEYRYLSEKYKKLLKQMMKVTRIGDVNYKKLMDANDRIREQKGELEILNKDLREANVVKDKFYSIIAHDLKNPLQVLLISSEILQSDLDGMESVEIKKYVGDIYKITGNLASLLENLLQWSRSQYGKIECRPRKLDLHRLAHDHMEYVTHNAQKKNIRLFLQIPEKTMVYADEDMLKSIIRNLVNNAVKFTSPGGSVILTSTEEGDYVVTTVSDTGVGIPQDKLPLLFKTDQNYTTPGTAKEKGTGLGLMLCKEFVEKNGGAIQATSQTGKGSIFTFSIPRGA